VQVRAIKLFADGALGSRGALLRSEYSDAPGVKGVPIMNETQIRDITIAALRSGFQVATHAIGDRAGEIVLNAYEQALASVPDCVDPRLRVEHAQMASAADIARYKKSGVIASIQACHCTSDMPWATARLGNERLQQIAYRWRSFLDAGVVVCNGSDTPVELPRPFWGMHAAVTRRGRADEGPGADYSGGAPDEVLTPEQALAAMTTSAAWAGFLENHIGSLEAGKYADFILVDRNPLTIASEDIHKVKVLSTWLGGRAVFQAT
jgi:predicted amidohydrolase YtcJ